MINHYERIPGGNFGDDLNASLWSKVWGKSVEEIGDNETYFIGIGTRIRRKNIPNNKRIVICGAGYGYETVPPVVDFSWDIRCVRGPLTAEKLNISKDKVITDPAILTALLYPQFEKIYEHSFIPHHLTLEEDNWESICKRCELNFINPKNDPDFVIQEIIKSKLIVTESLHGAIIADAFRIPWIPFYTRSHFSKFKWEDWATSMNLKINYQYIHPLFNVGVRNRSNMLKYILRKAYGFTISDRVGISELKKCLNVPSYLSDDSIFQQRLSEMKNCVDKIREDYGG